MNILFCNVAWMKNYEGNNDSDRAKSLVFNGLGEEVILEHENFLNINNKYYGFVASEFSEGSFSEYPLDEFFNVTPCTNEIKDILVVWVARDKKGELKLVGFEKHATVHREYIEKNLRFYNIEAEAKNSILIHEKKRDFSCEILESYFKNKAFGNILNIDTEEEIELKDFVDKLLNYIDNFSGKPVNTVYDEDIFDKVSKCDFENMNDYFIKLSELGDREDHLGIIEVLNKMILIDESLRECYEEKAYALYILNQYDLALHNLKIANNLDKKSLRSYTLMADIYYTLGEVESTLEACEDYFRVIEENDYSVDPELAIEMFRLKAYALCDLEKYEEAKECIEKAIEVCGEDEELIELKTNLQ